MTEPPQRDTGLAWLRRKAQSAVRLVTYKGGRAASRGLNLFVKDARHRQMRGRRAGRIAAEKTKNAGLTAVNLGRYAWRRLRTVHKPAIRFWRRNERARQQRAAHTVEHRLERDVRGRVSRDQPLILGPWFSEVGFEALYWVPFLRWLRAEHNWDPSRALAVSRGGVRSWYRDVAGHYLELFDIIDPVTFARRNEQRRGGPDGSHKQLAMSALDQEIIDRARAVPGFADATVIHPSDMYHLFKNYWLGHRGLSYIEDRTRFAATVPSTTFDLSWLPRDYVAVKAYTAASLPDTADNRRILAGVVEQLSERGNVVTLDTGLAIDDHQDYRLAGHPRVYNLGRLMTPANNLELQTAVIGGARAFIGTCGSLTWLAPMLGVPTVALMSETRWLHQHLYLARKVYLEHGGASFATVDVSGFKTLGIDVGSRIADAARPGN
ncbi:MAG TPA: hypothetical protein VNJ02_05040 [Vicinamibacterales bacterium]|nr:hypothetical protein [Vicinamibacterales bacterium]